MKNHAKNLKLFIAVTGRTTIKPPVISGDINKIVGYFPARVTEIRRW